MSLVAKIICFWRMGVGHWYYTVVFSSAVPSGSGAFQMPTRPSSASAASSASTLRGGGGKGKSQKRFSNFLA